MNKATLWHWKAVFLVTAGLCLFPVSPVFAACQANDTATATEVRKLAIGVLQIPASGSETCIVAGTSGANSCSGASTGTKIYGTIASGRYQLVRDNTEGTTACTITIDVQNISSGNANVTLGNVTGTYAGTALVGSPPWSGLARPATGRTLYLGMTATYDNNVPVGTLAPSFDIVVTYSAPAVPKASPQTGSMAFDSPITIDNVTDIDFGVVDALNTGRYTMNTQGNITVGLGGVLLGGNPHPGSMTIYGSATQTINITAGSYVAGGIGGGVTLTAATCAYDGGVEASCNTLSGQAPPTAAGKTLLIGVRALVDINQTAGSSAAPSFTVTVTYT